MSIRTALPRFAHGRGLRQGRRGSGEGVAGDAASSAAARGTPGSQGWQRDVEEAEGIAACTSWLPGELPWEVALHSRVHRSGEAGEREVSLSSPGNGEENHSSGGVSARETHLQS